MEDSTFIIVMAVAACAAAVAIWMYTRNASSIPLVIVARYQAGDKAHAAKELLEGQGISCLLSQDRDPDGVVVGPWLLRVAEPHGPQAIDYLRQDKELSAGL